MKKVVKETKRVFALLMAVLLVFGLIPVNPVQVSAEEGTPTLTINMDKTKANVTVIDTEGNPADSSIDENTEDNQLLYSITEGTTYTVTFEELDSNVIFDVRDTEGGSVTLTENAFVLDNVATDSVFEYNVYFESDTSVITVNYATTEIKTVASNVGTDISENSVTKYRVLKTDDVDLTVEPQKSTAFVTTDVGTSTKNEEENSYIVALGVCAVDREVNLSVEKVTVNASTTIDGASVKVFEDDVEVQPTGNDYIITKGSACYIKLDTTLEIKRLIATDGGDGTYTISNEYKIDLGTPEENKTVVISKKEFPIVTINYPVDKLDSIKVSIDGEEKVGSDGTLAFEALEKDATYNVTFKTMDENATVDTENCTFNAETGEWNLTISNVTSAKEINLEVVNVYTVEFTNTDAQINRLGADGEVLATVENGKLFVREDETNILLQIIPGEEKYISLLQKDDVDVDFEIDKLDTDGYKYLYDVTIADGTEISVECKSVNATKAFEEVISMTFTGTATDISGVDTYYIRENITLTPETESSETKKFLLDTSGFVDSKVISATTKITNVTILTNTTTFSEGMIQRYTFKPVEFVMDQQGPSVDGALSTKYFGPESLTIKLAGAVRDNNAVARVVYFAEEKAVKDDRDVILNATNSVIPQNDAYEFTINLEASTNQNVEYYVYAIDVAGNITKADTIIVTYDGTAPKGGSITIETEGGLVTSFLDFATVQRNTIKVTSTDITDENGSGLNSVKASLWREGDDEALETIELYAKDKKDRFERTVFEEGKKYYVSIVAIDNVGNKKEILEAKILGDVTKVVYDGSAPVINVTPNYDSNHVGVHQIQENTYYINQEVLNNGFLFDVFVKDYSDSIKADDYFVSGLENVTVTVNGKVISLGSPEGSVVSASYEEKSERTNDTNYKIKLKDYGITDKYVITFTAQDQAGNASALMTYTVYVDKTAPTVNSVTVNGTNATLGASFQSYGFFTKDKFELQFNGIDGKNGTADSKIARYVVEYLEGTNVVKTETIEGNHLSFAKQIVDNFKGTIRVTVYDKVGNNSTVTLVNGLICEKEATHASASGVAMSTPATDMKDVNGVLLYADNTSVSVVVTDTYAGINKIEWSVVAPYNTSSNASGSMTADALASGWTADTTDYGIITKVSGTIPVTNNSNNITVKVTVTDNAGNSSTNNIVVSIDKTTPTIKVSVEGDDADTQYTSTFNGDRVATVTIRERNFNAADAKVTITNTDGVIPSITEWSKKEDTSNPDNNTYTATVTFAADGDYTLDVAYTDLAKRTASAPAQQIFTIDKTNPTTSVKIDGNALNGYYFATDRTATIVINEHNFDSSRVQLTGTATNNGVVVGIPAISSWSTSGNTHTATVRFSADADYQLVLTGVDKAGNTFTYDVPNFVIDQEVPTITITGVEDKSANAGDVAPVITLGDTNYDANGVNITLVGANNGSMELNGSFSDTEDGQVFTFSNFPEEQSYDDIYTLTVTKTDMAGNETVETITFSVNRFGSVYTLSDELKEVVGKYVKAPFEIVITETNIDRLDSASIKVVLTINGAPKTLVLDTDYTITETGSDASWKQYVYTIKPSVFEGDGSYSLAIYSVDSAGNVNENINEVKKAEVVFGIDGTAPIIEAINFQDGFTSETAYTATISAIDNIILKAVKVLINGEEVEVTEENGMYSFVIPESSERQTVVVKAVDEAGNEATMEYTNILITSNPFISFINNTPLLMGSIAAVAAVSGGAGGFVIFRKRNVIKVKK